MRCNLKPPFLLALMLCLANVLSLAAGSLRFIHGPDGNERMSFTGSSASGLIAFGTYVDSMGRTDLFRWNNGGFSTIDVSTDATLVQASADGTRGAAVAGSNQAAYLDAGAIHLIPGLHTAPSSFANGIDFNGGVICGTDLQSPLIGRAFMYQPPYAGGNLVYLPNVPGNTPCSALCVDYYGTRIGGWGVNLAGQTVPVYWNLHTTDAAAHIIPLANGMVGGVLTSLSSNGALGAGWMRDGSGKEWLFRWSSSEGVNIVGTAQASINEAIISDDGSTILANGASTPIIWDQWLGASTLAAYFAASGFSLTGHTLDNVVGFSGSGQMVFGNSHGSKPEGFVAQLIPPRPAYTLSVGKNPIVGGNALTLTVAFPSAARANVTVFLRHVGNDISVPNQIVVKKGYLVGSLSVPTAAVSAGVVNRVYADFAGHIQYQDIVINPASLISLTLSASSFVGGAPAYEGTLTGKITLDGTTARATTYVVDSNDGAAISSPGALPLGAQSSSATFALKSHGVDSAVVVTVTASYQGVGLGKTVTIKPCALIALNSPYPATVKGGSSFQLTVFLTGEAGPSGIKVSLSSDKGAIAPIQPSLTVPSGHVTWPVTVQTGTVTTDTTVRFTAIYKGVSTYVDMTVLR